jgi:hypothetical protein
MVSGIPPVGITQNERFSSCDSVLLGCDVLLYFISFYIFVFY